MLLLTKYNSCTIIPYFMAFDIGWRWRDSKARAERRRFATVLLVWFDFDVPNEYVRCAGRTYSLGLGGS